MRHQAYLSLGSSSERVLLLSLGLADGVEELNNSPSKFQQAVRWYTSSSD